MNVADFLNASEPFTILKQWLEEVRQTPGIKEPTAMILATATPKGRPSSRTVLLKNITVQNQLIFYTNYDSRKGQELTQNPQANLHFYWDPLFRQINISGSIAKISRAESEAYWNSRPRDSQLSGWVSHQSQPLPDGVSLTDLLEQAKEKWRDKPVPCPANWGGFALAPTSIEFWQGQKYRLHDRVLFNKVGEQWKASQLFP